MWRVVADLAAGAAAGAAKTRASVESTSSRFMRPTLPQARRWQPLRSGCDRDAPEPPCRPLLPDRARGAGVHLDLPTDRRARLRRPDDSLRPEREALRAQVAARLPDRL